MKKNTKTKIVWITRTAMLIAVLIAVQAITAQFGNTLLTGSLVNLLLILSVTLSGFGSGLCVAVISPVFARLFGIGTPFWTLIPFIVLGNIVLVLIWHLMSGKHIINPTAAKIITAITAAVVKCGVLYAGVVKIAIPYLLELKEGQITALTAAFSLSQLITALIGGAIAIAILPMLKKALNNMLVS